MNNFFSAALYIYRYMTNKYNNVLLWFCPEYIDEFICQ